MTSGKSNPSNYDAIVAGAGLAGLAMTARLGSAGLRVLVAERQPRNVFADIRHDGRTTAIAYGSREILEACGVWDKLAPHTNPIDDITVADQHARPKVYFAADGNAPFGYIIDNFYFRKALFERIAEMPNITLQDNRAISGLTETQAGITATFADDTQASATVLIAADGRGSVCREIKGIQTRTWSYNQTALVCTIQHAAPHHNLAIENFYPAGPFAVLPMTENRSSIVWSDSPDSAKALSEMPEDEFIRRVMERGGGHLGAIRLVSGRMLYPLHFMLADELYKGRVALIGEAAHGMHPIAGQGLNLSLRDVAVLADEIIAAHAAGRDVNLEAYASARHFDHFTFMMATDLLEKLFSNNVAPIRWARQAGLGIVNRLPFAKRFFSRMAMGLLN